MPVRADVVLAPVITANWIGGGVNNLIETPTGVLYCVYVDSGSDVAFRKSTDGGLTWSNPTIVYAGTVTVLSIWYDRWSNIAAGKIHCAYADSSVDDIFYRSIDTEAADALGVQATVFLGLSTAAGGALSIVEARGGNLIIAGSLDAGAEDGAWKSTDAGATWAAAIADPSEAATQDQYLLLPGWNADTQDVQLIFWDASANELSVKRYDDSANTWAETLIATGMADQAAATAFPHFAAAVDLSNSRNLLIAWSAVDTLNADLRCWKIDDTTITEVTNVVLNSTDDQGLAALALDTLTNDLYAFYAGKSDGSETFLTNVSLCYKVSKDFGTTWGPETVLTVKAANNNIKMLDCAMRFSSAFGRAPAVCWYDDQTIDLLMMNAPLPASPRTTYQAGVV